MDQLDQSKIFDASYRRIKTDMDEFLETFYSIFLRSSPDIAELFKKTQMQHQMHMLRASLVFLVNFSADHENQHLKDLVQRHQQIYQVLPDHFDLWFESLLTAVARIDTASNEQVVEAWREKLTPAMDFFKTEVSQVHKPTGTYQLGLNAH